MLCGFLRVCRFSLSFMNRAGSKRRKIDSTKYEISNVVAPETWKVYKSSEGVVDRLECTTLDGGAAAGTGLTGSAKGVDGQPVGSREANMPSHAGAPKAAAKLLGEVTKSPNDRREYRTIQLTNGLTALLISDLKSSNCQSSCTEGQVAVSLEDEDDDNEDDENDEDSSSGDENEEESDSGCSDEELEKEEESPQHEKISKMKSSSGGEKLSAAALCIGVGSFSDPPDIPGLAHFLEHMVFMGSEKYPDENDFDAFVKRHGGNSNAFTDCERTVFYFDIERKHFMAGLDRFAQFFITPLMKKESVDREIQAVDSEFEMAVPSDFYRKQQLLASLAKDGNPMGKFMWGNKRTLKEQPAEEKIDIYKRLQEFQKMMYSAHYMTLAVQSRDSLDNLERLVLEIFSDVPNNGLVKQNFKEHKKPFHTPKFCKFYKAIPVKNVHQVQLTWDLPALQEHYSVKPLHYLGWLIGHEGKGSILSYLKKNLWALSLSGGNGETGFEHNCIWSQFCVSITLTEQGMENLYQVLTAVFQYLAMLRKVGPQSRVYTEIQTIEANEFRWQEQSDPVEYVEKMCENMQLYPVKDYISGETLLMEYDKELIRQCQDALLPSKASLLVYSKQFSGDDECNQKEPWFQTPYSVSDIPLEWLQSWENLEPNSAFHIPVENTYIASDFSIKEPDAPLTEFPVAITSTSQSKLWYKKDTEFNVPKAFVHFLLRTPVVNKSAQSLTLAELFVRLLEENLSEVAYAADVAQLSYVFGVNQRGLYMKLSGFNHKLPNLFETIVDYIGNFTVSEDLFSTIKEQQRKAYHNRYIKPKQLNLDVRLKVLEETFWSTVEKRESLESTTCSMLFEFVKNLKKQLFVEGLVLGNFTVEVEQGFTGTEEDEKLTVHEESKRMEKYLLNQLDCSPLPLDCRPQHRVLELPTGELYCRVQNLNNSDINSVITNYYQYGPGNMKEFVVNELVFMHMEEPCFDVLRTREQLGYHVFCTYNNTHGILGFSVTVCSQATKFSMQELDKHVEKFLVEFGGMLKNMSQEEFKTLVQAMVTLKKCEDTHMGEEAERHWYEIIMETYRFDKLTKQVELLEKLTLEEFQCWYDNLVPSCGKHKKLGIQVVGTSNKDPVGLCHKQGNGSASSGSESGSELEDDVNIPPGDHVDTSKVAKLTFVPVEEEIITKTVTDILKFKETCPVYPAAKIV